MSIATRDVRSVTFHYRVIVAMRWWGGAGLERYDVLDPHTNRYPVETTQLIMD